jgi:hypothetical protein
MNLDRFPPLLTAVGTYASTRAAAQVLQMFQDIRPNESRNAYVFVNPKKTLIDMSNLCEVKTFLYFS